MPCFAERSDFAKNEDFGEVDKSIFGKLCTVKVQKAVRRCRRRLMILRGQKPHPRLQLQLNDLDDGI